MTAERSYLSVEQVIRMHDELVRRFGGADIPGHRGESEGVSAAVLAVVNSYYEDLFEIAAAYAVYIVMGHVFGDGNKRTASAAALTFLELNGARVRARPKELRDVMLDLQVRAETSPRPPTSELVAWLAAWLEARSRAAAPRRRPRPGRPRQQRRRRRH